ncbi:hypothetical protein QR77_39200 [Streptomyces sp. 150FB]|uniref:NAD(P)-dependent oxidoreductase n=1 Tax=Streptomyces sp. 150FB TaxID=1576605 RepID=UPI0005895D55|nr:NAD(P)-dependent oxidoreductase [Streptomyces sp. 150FB]KIF78193.1 hypothetical protein QR77_39200 [Streptomyces sp. 150FB]
MKIAFLGLGRMGTELATHLVTDGHDVTVWNRTAEAAGPLVDLGARAAREASDAVAGAEVVVTVLFGADAVREVVPRGDLPIAEGALWIDVTTVSPDDTDGFARWAREHSVAYVHAPVVGSLAPARARAMGTLLGGDPDAVARARDVVVWADPARTKTYDTPAKAAVVKLIANLAIAVGIQGLVEALRLGHSGDLDTAEIISALDLTMLARTAGLKGPTILEHAFADTQFSTDLLTKDVRLMMRTSDSALPATAAALATLENAVGAGHGSADFSIVAEPDAG